MANYAAELNRTASTTLSVGSLVADATTPRRNKVYDLVVGSEASPADNAFLWQAQRCTAAGTSTAVTPQALDPADAAALSDVGENHTVDPTLTAGAILLAIALNQRATFRWVASPGGELVLPATASNGVALRTPTAGGLVAVSATIHFAEQ
jgi:hypothetical protein